MADGFEQMIYEAQGFFAELARNNERTWYEAHKDRYVENVKKPAEFFISLIAEDLARLTGTAMKPKLFRIHRDVRFSKDKTPYNPRLHMMWSPQGAHALTPRWFCGMGEGYFTVGLAVTGLQGETLAQFRHFIDRHGDGLQSAIDQAGETAGASLSDWGPAPLKRVPKPYEADHRHAELLKRKALIVSAQMPKDWETRGLVSAMNVRIKELLPVYTVLVD